MALRAAHTPGPWSVHPMAGSSFYVNAGEGRYDPAICNTWPGQHEPLPQEANARLIAAAPDLLEALKDAVDDLRQFANSRWSELECSADELVVPYEAAIAKATGQ